MPLDEIEKVVDKVVSPERITRWIVRVVLLIVLISVGVTVTKLALHMTSKVDAAITDYDWLANKHGEIKGAEVLELLAYGGLQRHQAEVKSRSGVFSISRKEDRIEYRRLNQAYTDATSNRSDLIEEYNTAASLVQDKTTFRDLPTHITFKHPFDKDHKE